MKIVLGLCLAMITASAMASPLTPDQKIRIRAIVTEARSKSPAPSTSVAVVVDGQLAYAEAFGLANLALMQPATPETRYDIGSVSKQFTAAAVLLMVQDGKLSLDDKIGRFFPNVSGAEKVTVRHLLSHEAGYRDSWQDTAEERRRPIAPQAIVDRWGAMPLAFEPGSSWDYSNTNYAIAGRIVETVSGRPLAQVLTERIFIPLGMTSAIDNETSPPTRQDANRYGRNLLGPARLTEPAARGWAYGAGGLSMSATDLARWDASVLSRTLLSPTSYDAMMRETMLTTGKGSGYGLGLYVDGVVGHRRVHHNGFAPGVITESRIYPDDGVAIVVTSNAEFGMVVPEIVDGIERLLLPAAFPRPGAYDEGKKIAKPPSPLIRRSLSQLRAGDVDRRRLTPEASAYLTPEVLADYRESLARLGPPRTFVVTREERVGEVNSAMFELSWPSQRVIGGLQVRDDGKISDLWLMAF
ncbi:serine hydrolase domain-containing protein [Caulobacter endophyticus]|uniref:serine hydrolase domain-containing protein n=1 Tax=Caulobacter endophyticus TaxID=2172652 RepID=UPI002410A514|nr:serine hydrolase domain-containing protein [Caulobacter endophyticus]MDG2530212.1 serine hydrolase [Caulobacter endophyticus]